VTAAIVRTFTVRVLVFGTLWWVVSEGAPSFGVVPLAVVALAAAASVPFAPPGSNPLSWRGVLRFAPYFVAQAVVGGIDVALRAWRPRLPVTPGLVTVPLTLRREAARVAFAWAVSLMPGTLAAVLTDDELVVHALDTTQPVRERLLELERRVAGMFRDEAP
jgi:multicomponent Na+:H+ antiporter subunit E